MGVLRLREIVLMGRFVGCRCQDVPRRYRIVDVLKVVSALCQNAGHRYWIWNTIVLIIAEQAFVPRPEHA